MPRDRRRSNSVALPSGVRAVWDLDKAERESTPTRERICLNGLWRWQPTESDANRTSDRQLGLFQGPRVLARYHRLRAKGLPDAVCTSELEGPRTRPRRGRLVRARDRDSQEAGPAAASSCRWSISTRMPRSSSMARRSGEARFPAGAVDLSAACRPGEKHLLSLHVIAMPLKGVLLSYQDTNSARQVPGVVNRRGLCGEVYLVGTPAGPRITDDERRDVRSPIADFIDGQGLKPRRG